MKLKKWLTIFIISLVCCIAVFALFNISVDAFGVFGDPFFDWYEYNMTINPRVAKIAYLDKHYEDYDSYILGSSKVSSIPVDTLNDYTGASFYNMTWYGGDLYDEEQAAKYIIEHYNVKNIIMSVTLDDAEVYCDNPNDMKQEMHAKADGSSKLLFYLKHAFCNPKYSVDKIKAYFEKSYLVNSTCVYTAETGCYNKQLRDIEPIGSYDEYMQKTSFNTAMYDTKLPYINEAIESIANVKKLCDEKGINFTLIGLPSYVTEFYCHSSSDIEEFYEKLSNVTDFYEFWGTNTITKDARYFYDYQHFRNCAGNMALAYVFNDKDVALPKDFGFKVTKANVSSRINGVINKKDNAAEVDAFIPILEYHAFTNDKSKVSETICLGETFESQIKALKELGYNAVFYQDLIEYVYGNGKLPDNPVVISMDDGYLDNLSIAAPILEKYGFKAQISVVGVSIGKDKYKDTNQDMIPHFDLLAAKEYVDKGILDIQSHSYDMHELLSSGARDGVLRNAGETEENYVLALKEDFTKSKEGIESVLGNTCNVYTYPYGFHDDLSDAVLSEMGVLVSVLSEHGTNTVVKGIPQSLLGLKRLNVSGSMNKDDVIKLLESN